MKDKKCKFSKKIVVFCIIFIVLYTIAQIVMNYLLSVEISPTLTTCVYAFFGTELASTALIRIFDKGESTGETITNSEDLSIDD